MVYISNLLEPEEDILSSRNGIQFPTVSFDDSNIQYIIDDLFTMLYFSFDSYNKEFDIFKFKKSYTVEALKRNVKYDNAIDKFPMPRKVDCRVAYPLYTNSTGLNLGIPRVKLEQLNDTLKKYR